MSDACAWIVETASNFFQEAPREFIGFLRWNDLNHHVEVAGRTAIDCWEAASADAHLLTARGAWRDLERNGSADRKRHIDGRTERGFDD